MARVTQNRADPNLVELLVTRSFDTFCWMRDKGVRFIPIYGRQAFKIEGKFKFWGGLTVEAVGGGPGLIKMLTDAATKRGIKIRYQTRALGLIYDGVRVEGVRIRHAGVESELRSKSVVLACGGFESNSEWRTRYLGPGWDLAKVRGTRFNTGDGIRMLAMRPQNRPGRSVITRGPGAMPWIISAPIIIAMVGLPGMPKVNIGMNEVCAPALLADSGAATPLMSPWPNRRGGRATFFSSV